MPARASASAALLSVLDGSELAMVGVDIEKGEREFVGGFTRRRSRSPLREKSPCLLDGAFPPPTMRCLFPACPNQLFLRRRIRLEVSQRPPPIFWISP